MFFNTKLVYYETTQLSLSEQLLSFAAQVGSKTIYKY